MRHRILACFLLCWFALFSVVFMAAGPARAAEEGYVDLFNGKNLDHWVAEGQTKYRDKGGMELPAWTVADGMLTCADGAGFGFLRYDGQKYSDFILHAEYRMSKNCNSGIGIRTPPFTGDINTRPSHAAYEIQILDDAGKKPGLTSHGSLYNYVAPTSNEGKPANQWNEMEIECRGPRIKVKLNGRTVQDIDQTTMAEIKDKPLSGSISLQNHGHKIEFRSVRIKDLAAAKK
ncbi:MAG TPA: DUF1080 domain-containing protein [Pirellulales bacterium]|jgi:hypothetical protein|nr:DUF1080 domain-containing protein [Pirellulales bacterium]